MATLPYRLAATVTLARAPSNRFDHTSVTDTGRQAHERSTVSLEVHDDVTDLGPDAPLRRRAEHLLARLSPEERLAMLHQAAPAVERLGLASFRTGTEALHGVAWLGTATVFPQPVGLAATWDVELLRRVGDAVATEVRAKHAADPTVSLNVWAPVVNPLRHPAWGRTEEGWSEDPHLTARLAGAYAHGLRGDHPRVWKTVPTLKHYLAYGNETDRAVTSSNLSLRTLHEFELPAYRGPVEAGVVGAVMPSYNLVDGRPNHVARELLDELRSWAPGSIAVVSDAAAPTNLVVGERYFPDHATSHAAALRAGVDSFTDNDADAGPTTARLTGALARGLLTQDDVDRAVLRLLELRLRTGELDGDADPYRGIGPDAIDLPAHRALAREAVARSVVVLRNDGVLPLSAPTRVAVVGPLADRMLTDWYSGTPPYAVGVGTALAERLGDAHVEVVTGADTVALRSTSAHAYLAVSDAGEAGAVVAASEPTASPATHLEVTDWGDGLLTLRSCLTGRLLTGAGWIVRAEADRVGGWVVQESFRRHQHADGTWSLQHVGSGRWLRVQHGSGSLVADALTADDAERLVWRTVRAGLPAVADAAARADVVVVTVGNDPHLSGRETEDRPHLDVPQAAVEVWRAARDACDRSVLAVVSSYPYVLGPELADAGAVVWTSHGGQELGHGLVDVLVGDAEPTGRLAQSWPARAEDAGDLLDYDVAAQGATYRHATAEAAFAFGHGLTYTTVEYEAVVANPASVDAPAPTHRHPALGDSGTASRVDVTVTVRNSGPRPAEELVQVYALAPQDLPLPPARRLLVAFERVRLEPGERREVRLSFDVARLAVWDPAARAAEPGPDDWLHAGALRVQPGEYVVAAGPSSADLPVRAALRVAGPPAPARRAAGTVVPAHASHAAHGVVPGDRTRERGAALDVAAGSTTGWARYDGLDLAGVEALELLVACERPVHGRITVVWRATGDDGGAWRPLSAPVRAHAAGGHDARYDWRPVRTDLVEVPDGVVDLRVDLPIGVRLAELRFVTASG
ncbi:glycoside hydrolase family 3 C-terminal domain-containing protein [Isoptericola variabilis]|uniref:Beta-glucosidase n=1 Tax=Isoptericola variabilis (strain 225) TaxID=743718 RepID=F6FR64_ISOV2|nr:glycoside hydrolase family 3 C-terminal domain-containing protein [Isoptericola variabilis]AEG45014.1 Beta-glucosidase [Isoptericola variabilis 225]TWH26140.1 beta-glucosidase [Isoptericola variabilis J7]